VIDTANEALLTEIPVPPYAHGVEFPPDGKRAYVADTIPTWSRPPTPPARPSSGRSRWATARTAVRQNRPVVVDVNYDGDSVSVIDSDSDEVIATVGVGRHPQNITWSADGRFAYVTKRTRLGVGHQRGRQLGNQTIPTGHSPSSVAVLADGSRGYVSNFDDDTLTVLNLAG